MICLQTFQGFSSRSGCSLSSVGTDGAGCGMVISKSCSLAMGSWFVCFAGSERQIIIYTGRLVGVPPGIILLVP